MILCWCLPLLISDHFEYTVSGVPLLVVFCSFSPPLNHATNSINTIFWKYNITTLIIPTLIMHKQVGKLQIPNICTWSRCCPILPRFCKITPIFMHSLQGHFFSVTRLTTICAIFGVTFNQFHPIVFAGQTYASKLRKSAQFSWCSKIFFVH